MMRISEYLSQNPLWKAKMRLSSLHMDLETMPKNTPIYITGTFGAQGKSTLKRLLEKNGFTAVKEYDDTHKEAIEDAKRILTIMKKSGKDHTEADFKAAYWKRLDKRDAYYKEEYAKNGIVVDFGPRTLRQIREELKEMPI